MKRFREVFERYERRISALAIVSAFIIDSVTLVRIDEFLTELLLVVYLLVVAGGIIFINLRENGRLRWLSEEAYLWLFVFVQFAFGGLFGRFFIYYSRSGAFATSWPFLIIFLALLIGNEFAKKYYTRLLLQVGFFFLALFAFMVLFVPLIVHSIGTWTFLLSGAMSLLVMAGFIRLLGRLLPEQILPRRPIIMGLIGLIFAVMNLLYFRNLIPPIPLALRDAGVYHSVTRSGNEYIVTGEASGRFDFLKHYHPVHLLPGEPVYVYSAVFAPTNFDTAIVHQWQHYDETKKAWVDAGTITFPIVGGQDRGYRGYSVKSNAAPGRWRVSIQTSGGQVIGLVRFEVSTVNTEPALVTKSL